jgi:hypothetical protein
LECVLSNGMAGGADATTGNAVAAFSPGGCSGVDSEGGATGGTWQGVELSSAVATRSIWDRGRWLVHNWWT